MSSVVVWAVAQYSAPVLDHESVFYFFAHYDMSLLLRKVQYPVVERLVVGQPIQYASEKAHRSSLVWEVNFRTKLIVPLTYHKIRRTIFR